MSEEQGHRVQWPWDAHNCTCQHVHVLVHDVHGDQRKLPVSRVREMGNEAGVSTGVVFVGCVWVVCGGRRGLCV
jgi:hypothetical protein